MNFLIQPPRCPTLGRMLAALFGLFGPLALTSLVVSAQTSSDSLEIGFRNPPKEARPSTYYLMLNGYLNAEHMEKELEEFHKKGVAGLCVFDMGARGSAATVPPAGPPFLSDIWLESFSRILRKAAELDMDAQLSVSSSWDMGADWVRPNQASMGLYEATITREGPGELDEVLPFPTIPKDAPRDTQGNPLFWRDVAVLAFRVPVAAGEDGNVNPPGPTGNRKAFQPGAMLIPDRKSISNLTSRLAADGRLRWSIPKGKWRIVRYVCANTGETLKVPSPNSNGLATDHFSAEATRDYIRHVLDRLESRLGDLRKTALKQLYLASYEVRGAIWTPDFLDQFKKYRGYDMTEFLPALSGTMVEDQKTTERFLYDYRKTLGDLVVDAYYRATVETAAEAGLGVEAEAGGPGPPTHQVPVDALKALGALTELRGEFWPWRMDRPGLWVVKETASAAHIYGRKRVHMEAFTSFRHWQDGPSDLKPSADRAFCEGMNHVVWHTASHQPPEGGLPGWVYGAGTHLTPNRVWWPMAKPFLDYLARCSFLLQQGRFVADVCYYYGDQGFNFVPPKHIDPSLGYGFDYDVTNAEALQDRMSVEEGRIVLPDGIQYELLVLPEEDAINPSVLERISDLVRAGATVAGPKPARATGLADRVRRDERVRRMADDMWGTVNEVTAVNRPYGRGRVIWGKSLREILADRRITPDFSWNGTGTGVEVDFIHRRTSEAEIYFVRNLTTHELSGTATFRVQGKSPELWRPETGGFEPVWTFEETTRGIRIPMSLDAGESVFVVFRESAVNRPRFNQVDQRLLIRGVSGTDARIAARENDSYTVSAAGGRTVAFEVTGIPDPLDVVGPWNLLFASGPRAPSPVTWPALKSWTQDADPDVRCFSGIVRYEKNFDLPSNWFNETMDLSLDLGDLWAAGEVFLNGESAGIVWKPPYTVDVSELAKPGTNRLQIDIANTWANRIIGDTRFPREKRVTRTNITGSGTPRKRWEDIEPRASGLFGPVTLRASQLKTVSLPQEQ